MSVLKGFKDFVLRGNVVDLAVGVVIGAAFGDLVKSMVADVITPAIGDLMKVSEVITPAMGSAGGTRDFSELTIGSIKIGKFINAVVSFAIIAGVVYFAVVLPMNRLLTFFKSPEIEKEVPLTKDQLLLVEIRDTLRAAPRQA